MRLGDPLTFSNPRSHSAVFQRCFSNLRVCDASLLPPSLSFSEDVLNAPMRTKGSTAVAACATRCYRIPNLLDFRWTVDVRLPTRAGSDGGRSTRTPASDLTGPCLTSPSHVRTAVDGAHCPVPSIYSRFCPVSLYKYRRRPWQNPRTPLCTIHVPPPPVPSDANVLSRTTVFVYVPAFYHTRSSTRLPYVHLSPSRTYVRTYFVRRSHVGPPLPASSDV